MSDGRRLNVGDPIPLVLTKEELAAGLGYSLRQIDRFRTLHNHPAIKELAGPGQVRFDGRAVKAWIDGGAQERRFFNSASRGR